MAKPHWLDAGVESWEDYFNVMAKDGTYGDHLVLTLKDDDDTYHAVHAIHSVLKDRLFDLKPKVGETITVAYHGKVVGKNKDREYHAYTVINHSHLEEAGAELTWYDEEPAF